MTALQRITTQYIEPEDRIRLSGETTAGHTVAVWLTQRLLLKLLPHMLAWLEQGGRSTAEESPIDNRINEHLLEFAQQIAQKDLEAQPAVSLAADTRVWLSHTIDVTQLPDAIKLVFKGNEDNNASLILNNKELRQWLAILYNLWKVAGWQGSLWPKWITDTVAEPTRSSGKSVH